MSRRVILEPRAYATVYAVIVKMSDSWATVGWMPARIWALDFAEAWQAHSKNAEIEIWLLDASELRCMWTSTGGHQ